MKNNHIIITILDENTFEQQVEVYRSAFNPVINKDENLIVWRKKHYENPLGNSLIFGAFFNDQLVGINAFMPVEYNYDGKQVKMLQSSVSGVLPSFRGKGIWRKIVTYALDYISKKTDFELVIGFPNYINSYPGFKKMGWKTVSNMKNYVMINNLTAFKSVFQKRNVFYRLLLNGIVLQRIGIYLYKSKKFYIEDSIVEDLIWPDINTKELNCSRTVELLKWKEDYKKLIPICIKIGEKTIATCLYGLSTYRGYSIIKLESFGVASNYQKKEKQLFACFLKFFAWKHPKVAFVRVWAQENSYMSSLLKGMFFICSSHPNPFIVSNAKSIYADKSWSLSFFDLD